MAAREAEAVHGDRRNAGAIGGVPGPAGRAAAAVDLEGNHDALACADRRDVLADRQHLRDALVAKLHRKRERARAKRDEGGHVAGGDRDRADHRTSGPGRLWGGHAAPDQAPAGDGHKRAHAGTSRPDALTDVILAGACQTTQTLLTIALQPHPCRCHAVGSEQSRVMAHPAVWPVSSRPAPSRDGQTPKDDAHRGTAGAARTNSRTARANASGWSRMMSV